MNCPKCGKEMRKGELDAKRPVVFSAPNESGFPPVTVVKLRGVFGFEPLEAELCEDCRCAIVNY